MWSGCASGLGGWATCLGGCAALLLLEALADGGGRQALSWLVSLLGGGPPSS